MQSDSRITYLAFPSVRQAVLWSPHCISPKGKLPVKCTAKLPLTHEYSGASPRVYGPSLHYRCIWNFNAVGHEYAQYSHTRILNALLAGK